MIKKLKTCTVVVDNSYVEIGQFILLTRVFMKKFVALVALVLGCGAVGNSYGDEWVPMNPIVQKIEYVPYYYSVPAVTMVPVVTQYVPMVRYENVMVETQHWCLLKKYQVVTVPRVVYIPVNQGVYRY